MDAQIVRKQLKLVVGSISIDFVRQKSITIKKIVYIKKIVGVEMKLRNAKNG